MIFTVVGVIAITIIFYFLFGTGSEEFNVNTLFLKSVVKQNEVSSLTFKISNLAGNENFAIQTRNLDNLVSISQNNISLLQENEVEIVVTFNATNINPGVYIGSISIDNGDKIKIIPVIMEVQTQEQLFAITMDVAPEYKEVSKGSKLLTSVEFFNLADTDLHQVDVEYDIRDVDNNNIVSIKENVSVSSSYDITKIMNLPGDIKPGDYVFVATLKYKDSFVTSSYMFKVKSQGLGIELNFYSILIMGFLIAIVLVVIYIIYERNKLFNELAKNHQSALDFYSDNIDEEKTLELNKAKNNTEKEKILKEFEDAKKRIISEIRKEQEKQKSELEKLKRQNKEKEMKSKIKQWKNIGYKKAVKTAKIDPSLKRKLEALENAKLSGLISNESYNKGSRRLKNLMKK